MPRAAPHFIGTCVGLQEEDLHDYDESTREITYATFARHMGADAMRHLEREMGYNKHLRLRKDWSVRFSRGKWRGKPAICMMHSATHHLWALSA